MTSTILYGIANCDTIKKARSWLEQYDVSYRFHDYKKEGVDEARLRAWSARTGWELLLNRAGTTFRKLPDAGKAGIDEAKAIALMLANPAMIKRPVLERGDTLLIGFMPERYAEALG